MSMKDYIPTFTSVSSREQEVDRIKELEEKLESISSQVEETSNANIEVLNSIHSFQKLKSKEYTLTANQVMQIPVVKSIVTLIANQIAGTPMKVYDSFNGGNEVVELPDDIKSILRNPSFAGTYNTCWSNLIIDIMTMGRGYQIKIVRQGKTYLEYVPFAAVERTYTGLSLPRYAIKNLDEPKLPSQGINSARMLDYPYLTEKGYSIFENHKIELTNALLISIIRSNLLKKGGPVPFGLLLNQNLSPKQEKELVKNIHEGGSYKDPGNPLVLSGGITSAQINSAPLAREWFLVDAGIAANAEVARLYNMPNHMLGDNTGQLSFGSDAQKMAEGILFRTADPIAQTIEEIIYRSLFADREELRDLYPKFDRRYMVNRISEAVSNIITQSENVENEE